MGLTCAGLGLGTVSLRHRLGGLRRLEPSDLPVDARHRFLVADGVELDEHTRRAASALAVREGFQVLDLVPGDLPTRRLLDFARSVDTAAYVTRRLARGRTAGQVIMAEAAVLDRAGLAVGEKGGLTGLSPADLAKSAAQLKICASNTSAFAMAPGLKAGPQSAADRVTGLRALPALPSILSASVLAGAGMAACLALAPLAGAAALVLFSMQPWLVVAGRPLRPRDLAQACALRVLLGPYLLLRSLAASLVTKPPTDPHADLRPQYAADLSTGTDKFLEPPRQDCPWCGSSELGTCLITPDLHQCKPGRFTLAECRFCGHVFQNPRLTLAGLEFYYRDYYDGIGQVERDAMFALMASTYRDRARLVRSHTTPRSWLDVGTGHGHFPLIAQDILTDTEFDGLDMTTGVEIAERRGWISRGYRGMFPDLAEKLAGRYDVVSMHHYLEHAREPFAELDAAAAVLDAGGHLLIEVPDHTSRLGAVLGRFWMNWCQPQHLHFMPVGNLKRALADRGFTIVAEEHGKSHLFGDFTVGVSLLANALVPDPKLPWLPYSPTLPRRLARAAVYLAALPAGPFALLLDVAICARLRRTEGGNMYRLLATKAPEPTR